MNGVFRDRDDISDLVWVDPLDGGWEGYGVRVGSVLVAKFPNLGKGYSGKPEAQGLRNILSSVVAAWLDGEDVRALPVDQLTNPEWAV